MTHSRSICIIDITLHQKTIEDFGNKMHQQVFSQNIFDLIHGKALSMVNQVEFQERYLMCSMQFICKMGIEGA